MEPYRTVFLNSVVDKYKQKTKMLPVFLQTSMVHPIIDQPWADCGGASSSHEAYGRPRLSSKKPSPAFLRMFVLYAHTHQLRPKVYKHVHMQVHDVCVCIHTHSLSGCYSMYIPTYLFIYKGNPTAHKPSRTLEIRCLDAQCTCRTHSSGAGDPPQSKQKTRRQINPRQCSQAKLQKHATVHVLARVCSMHWPNAQPTPARPDRFCQHRNLLPSVFSRSFGFFICRV